MKKVLITGISGQLGQHLAKYLKDTGGYHIIGTHRHKSNDRDFYLWGKDHIEFDILDLNDQGSIEACIRKHQPDYFINTAANAFVGESWSLSAQHMLSNAMAVLHELEAIKNFSPHTRFYSLGTSEEFGDVLYSPQDENHPFRPRSPYGASKCAAHHLVKVYRESYGLYAIQGIQFNFESCLRGEKYVTRKITKGLAERSAFLKRGLSGVEPLYLGNLYAKRDWQHAFDVCDGIWRMLNQDTYNPNWNGNPEEYVLSSGITTSVKDFVNAVLEYLNISGEWQGVGSMEEQFVVPSENIFDKNPVPLIKISPDFYRPNEVSLLIGDSSKIKKELGWSPKYSLRDIVSEMVEFDISHEAN